MTSPGIIRSELTVIKKKKKKKKKKKNLFENVTTVAVTNNYRFKVSPTTDLLDPEPGWDGVRGGVALTIQKDRGVLPGAQDPYPFPDTIDTTFRQK